VKGWFRGPRRWSHDLAGQDLKKNPRQPIDGGGFGRKAKKKNGLSLQIKRRTAEPPRAIMGENPARSPAGNQRIRRNVKSDTSTTHDIEALSFDNAGRKASKKLFGARGEPQAHRPQRCAKSRKSNVKRSPRIGITRTTKCAGCNSRTKTQSENRFN